jgi:hypothetical protein
MKRRDFIKTAGVATVASVGAVGLSFAGVKNEEHIPWEEIERVIIDQGFNIHNMVDLGSFPLKDTTALRYSGKPPEPKMFYRMLYENGDQHHIGFERLENKEGKGKLTFVYFSFQQNWGDSNSAGVWTEHPLARFYLDPNNWEEELREALSSGLSKKFNS